MRRRLRVALLVVIGACSRHAAETRAPADDAGAPAHAAPDAAHIVSRPPSPVRQLALGDRFAVALLDDGSVWRWGKTLDGINPRPGRTAHKDIVAVAVADDYEYMCVVDAGGRAVCGGNHDGGWGDWWATDAGVEPGTRGLEHVTKMAVSDRHFCALLRDGTVRCWGYNRGEVAAPVKIAGVKNAVQLVEGDFHACALEQDGTVWCWGGDEYGQLGDRDYAGPTGRIVTHGDEMDVVGIGGDKPARRVAGLGHVTQLTAAGIHDCVLVDDGTVWCWGGDSSGELGDGRTTSRSEPKAVPGLTDVVEIASGADNSCARKRDGHVVCWGHDMTVDVLGMDYARGPAPVAGLDDAVQIAVGSYSACAVRKDGEVACWGSPRDGQHGDGDGTDPSVTTVSWLRSP